MLVVTRAKRERERAVLRLRACQQKLQTTKQLNHETNVHCAWLIIAHKRLRSMVHRSELLDVPVQRTRKQEVGHASRSNPLKGGSDKVFYYVIPVRSES